MVKKSKKQQKEKSDCGCESCGTECTCCLDCGNCPCSCAPEVVEEPVAEEPQPEPRDLPVEAGEETSETKMVGGQMMRVIKSATGTEYKPL
jgi:hypothetical protein